MIRVRRLNKDTAIVFDSSEPRDRQVRLATTLHNKQVVMAKATANELRKFLNELVEEGVWTLDNVYS